MSGLSAMYMTTEIIVWRLQEQKGWKKRTIRLRMANTIEEVFKSIGMGMGWNMSGMG
jgi:hypothetical protein